MLKRADWRSFLYGLIGTGSLVVIADSRRRIVNTGWTNEFDRPIYFLELRSGYACARCRLRDERLVLQPRHASRIQRKSK